MFDAVSRLDNTENSRQRVKPSEIELHWPALYLTKTKHIVNVMSTFSKIKVKNKPDIVQTHPWYPNSSWRLRPLHSLFVLTEWPKLNKRKMANIIQVKPDWQSPSIWCPTKKFYHESDPLMTISVFVNSGYCCTEGLTVPSRS